MLNVREENGGMQTRSRLLASFQGLKPASAASSHAEKMNRNSDTAHECILRSVLWKRDLCFRKDVRTLAGKPDIVFTAVRVAVFCDADFWHGRDWQTLSTKLRSGTNADYWIPKISANRKRDSRNNRLLKKEGWIVVRIWETDIHNDLECAARTIENLVRRANRGVNAIH